MKKSWLVFLLAGLPALVGLMVWLAFRLGWLTVSIVYLRVSLGILFLMTGVLMTTICGAGVVLYFALARRFQSRVNTIQAEGDAERSQFLLRLDHELKNPLTTMQIEVANLELESTSQAGDPLPGPSAKPGEHDAVQRLKEQMTRMNDLAIQLRKLGELEGHPIEREPIRLDDLLADLVDEFQASGDGSQREITLSLPQIPWPLPEIVGDADLVYLALRNVMGNAVKFSRPGDVIQVRAFEDMTQAVVEIADQGPGIAKDELPHVWEELYRGKSARGLPGSGLGLPIVKAIIERHGGQATLLSRPGQGTVVILRFPTHL